MLSPESAGRVRLYITSSPLKVVRTRDTGEDPGGAISLGARSISASRKEETRARGSKSDIETGRLPPTTTMR